MSKHYTRALNGNKLDDLVTGINRIAAKLRIERYLQIDIKTYTGPSDTGAVEITIFMYNRSDMTRVRMFTTRQGYTHELISRYGLNTIIDEAAEELYLVVLQSIMFGANGAMEQDYDFVDDEKLLAQGQKNIDK